MIFEINNKFNMRSEIELNPPLNLFTFDSGSPGKLRKSRKFVYFEIVPIPSM